jgi:hypothetical protein
MIKEKDIGRFGYDKNENYDVRWYRIGFTKTKLRGTDVVAKISIRLYTMTKFKSQKNG